jgi:hypothetical protein
LYLPIKGTGVSHETPLKEEEKREKEENASEQFSKGLYFLK